MVNWVASGIIDKSTLSRVLVLLSFVSFLFVLEYESCFEIPVLQVRIQVPMSLITSARTLAGTDELTDRRPDGWTRERLNSF